MDTASLGSRGGDADLKGRCPGFEDHTVCSDWFGKFSTLHGSSRTFQEAALTRSDPSWLVLSMELSRFYHRTLWVQARLNLSKTHLESVTEKGDRSVVDIMNSSTAWRTWLSHSAGRPTGRNRVSSQMSTAQRKCTARKWEARERVRPNQTCRPARDQSNDDWNSRENGLRAARSDNWTYQLDSRGCRGSELKTRSARNGLRQESH